MSYRITLTDPDGFVIDYIDLDDIIEEMKNEILNADLKIWEDYSGQTIEYLAIETMQDDVSHMIKKNLEGKDLRLKNFGK